MFTIDNDKLVKVTQIFNSETDETATKEVIEKEICANWNEGEEHQKWIDTAEPSEIADWLTSFYSFY